MRSPLRYRNVLMPLSLLLMTCALAGCLTTQSTTQPAETSAVAAVCRAWPVVTYSFKDTAQTQVDARASNAARKAWGCP